MWKSGREDADRKNRKAKKKFRFAEIARAVKFTSRLFQKALSKRIKATILYATETGRSEKYARWLNEVFNHAFNSQVGFISANKVSLCAVMNIHLISVFQVVCMADYDTGHIEHETLLLIVTSTFGNGDPPENGEVGNFAVRSFAK